VLAQRLWRLDQVLRLLEPCEVSRRGCDNALPLGFVSLPSSTEIKRKETNCNQEGILVPSLRRSLRPCSFELAKLAREYIVALLLCCVDFLLPMFLRDARAYDTKIELPCACCACCGLLACSFEESDEEGSKLWSAKGLAGVLVCSAFERPRRAAEPVLCSSDRTSTKAPTPRETN